MSTSASVRFAAIQLNCRDDVEANLRAVSEHGTCAAEAGARVLLLPENFAYLGHETGKREIAESLDDEGPILAAVRALARDTGTTVIAGGMPERSSDPARPYNTCVVVEPDGGLSARYRKIHLFDVTLPDGTVLSESVATSAASEPVVAEVAGLHVGLSICYDLRFPELYRRLVDSGADVLVVPAAFTLQTGKEHWHALLRARAIESQCWVVAAAQWGRHPADRASYGHSLVCDPWGTVVAECGDRPGWVAADVDPAYTAEVRSKLPSLRHRRL